jgi:alanine transaminase
MKARAKMLTETFNSMTNFTCNEIEGAMYAFPKIRFSKRAMKRAAEMRVQPDFMYCLDMLNETGIMVVPGSGFGQEPGTYHFRITNLVTPTSEMESTLERLREFNERFHERFDD